jgi:predicted DNA-binding transcriptional regulator YafY
MSYTAHGGERTARHVEPHRLVSLGRRWYLVAYDLTRHDWRSFRLDRVGDPRGTGMRFRPRELPVDDAAAFVRAGIDAVPATQLTPEALVHAPAETVRAAIGQWVTVEALDGDRCRLRMTSDSLDWPAMALGMVRADFEVLAPPELVDHIREWAPASLARWVSNFDSGLELLGGGPALGCGHQRKPEARARYLDRLTSEPRPQTRL